MEDQNMIRQRLTALVPAHNDDYTLDLCLRSISHHFDEIIVLDDCSDDHTAEVVLEAATQHRHIRLTRHEGNQLGWVEARNRLLGLTDSLWLFWLDADDILIESQAGLLRQIAEGPHAAVRLQLAEMWGDFAHTTQRLKHYDRCHVFLDRSRLPAFRWAGVAAAKIECPGGPHSMSGPGPLFWHIKGVKPDRRLMERQVMRSWLRSRATGNHFGPDGTVAICRYLDQAEIHRRAVWMLLRSKIDRIQRLGTWPPLPEAIRAAPSRFQMLYRDGCLVDRLDHGWRFAETAALRQVEGRFDP
jgi:glycosyltransferase involved in cell wall biosynthesis